MKKRDQPEKHHTEVHLCPESAVAHQLLINEYKIEQLSFEFLAVSDSAADCSLP